MTVFGRSFPVERLSDPVLKENVWLCDLLGRWHPAGNSIGERVEQESEEHLRLAIRNGYLNFYRAGQSVAKVEFHRGKLQAEIHKKYVYGDDCGEQGYVKLTSDGFPEYGTGLPIPYDVARLRKWISGAHCHGGAEKRFVDLVVGRNPNIVNFEMGLPAYSEARTAPRMDLVGLEPVDDRWRIVFWEAKLVEDGRARSRGEPRVIRQLTDYTQWLGHGNHRDLVAEAYQRACRLLVDLHAVAKRYRSDIEELGRGIREVAARDAPPLSIDDKPRLLIDDRSRNIAFTKNGHLCKLLNTGLQVQIVQGEGQMTLETRA
jgi:hypothetical protein